MSRELKIPFPERLLNQHGAILGKTGAGKSSAMRVIAEHLLDAKRRVCIVDPKGDWWGLKSSADGKSAGYPVITFGDFKEPRATDVPINPASGKEVAELIATGNRPCVIGFRGWMPGQLVKFWLDFAPKIFNTVQGELYVFIDEVQNFAPKGKIMDPESGKCLHWTNRIMSEGRGLGLTFFIASQRAQKVHNDTLDNCETLVAMRVAHPAARQSIKDWIDGNGDPAKGKDVLASLAQLKRGEAWVWSPENDFGPDRVQFPMFQTFDSFAPPQLQKKISDAGWSEVDLDQVKTKLAAVIAETKANDPKELRQEIARLKQELSKKHAPTAAPRVDAAAIGKATDHAVRQATFPLIKELERVKLLAGKAIRNFTEAASPLNAIANMELPAAVMATPVKVETPRLPSVPIPATVKSNGHSTGVRAPVVAGDLPEGEKKVLRAIAGYQDGAERDTITVLTAYKRSSRDTYIQRLSGRGFVTVEGNRVVATDAGVDALGPEFEPMPTGEALQEYWRRRLPEGERRIFELLLINGNSPVDREFISEKTDYKRSSRDTYLQRLASRRVIDVLRGGQVKAADLLFID